MHHKLRPLSALSYSRASAQRPSRLLDFLQRHRVGAITTALVVVADQFSKRVAIQALAIGESWPREGFFQFTHVVNTGSAFGIFGGYNTLLVTASLGGIVFLFVLYGPRQRPIARVQLSFGLLLAGALGNLIDRIFIGHVTDFIDVVPWCIFNLADVALVIGTIAFVYVLPTAGRQKIRPSLG